jgi:glycine C-acetyltransferase
MPVDRCAEALRGELAALALRGTAKGAESVNSNNYLGMALRPELIAAEEKATQAFGVGPGAVRFISGTYRAHVDLEARLAAFHGRESAMIFSAAYACVLGVLVPLATPETVLISDELNHNCIINALRLARPKDKQIYKHLDMTDLEAKLAVAAGTCRRAVVVTDGVFSMRGAHAPLPRILELAEKYDDKFPENVVVVVDDSHGVGAFGATGRGTEEHTGSGPADVLVGTLGKALGVNGGYVVGSKVLTDFLRETAATYIYSNPITVGECAAALAAVEILDGPRGLTLLAHLREMTQRFRDGLARLGLETIPGDHPVVPLMVRDTPKTNALVAHLRQHGVLATGLKYPVVPRGDESIRFQVSADHTAADLDAVLAALGAF